MTTYYFAGGITPAAVPYRGAGRAQIFKKIDIPDLIANGGLVDSSGNALALASTGFTDEDILKIPVNKGTLVKQCFINVLTAEGGACTCKVGCQTSTQVDADADDDDGWMADVDLNAVAYDRTQHDDGYGCDNYGGIMFITDGYIDIEFNTAATAVAVFEFAAEVLEVFNAAL